MASGARAALPLIQSLEPRQQDATLDNNCAVFWRPPRHLLHTPLIQNGVIIWGLERENVYVAWPTLSFLPDAPDFVSSAEVVGNPL